MQPTHIKLLPATAVTGFLPIKTNFLNFSLRLHLNLYLLQESEQNYWNLRVSAIWNMYIIKSKQAGPSGTPLVWRSRPFYAPPEI